jgi:hypothetical protein
LRDPQLGYDVLFGLDDDLDVVSEGDQKPQQALYGIAAELASEKGRHFELVDSHGLSGSGLRHFPSSNDPLDLDDDSGLDQMLVGVGKS